MKPVTTKNTKKKTLTYLGIEPAPTVLNLLAAIN